jgi:hypothetical protein
VAKTNNIKVSLFDQTGWPLPETLKAKYQTQKNQTASGARSYDTL